jgi:hypothetical protein
MIPVFSGVMALVIASVQVTRADDVGRTVSLVKMPYRGERNLPDLSDSPDYLEAGGLSKLLEGQGWRPRRCRPSSWRRRSGRPTASGTGWAWPTGSWRGSSPLDPPEVAGHPLTVPGGPTSVELAAALADMFRHPKAAAFGVASTPSGEHDRDGRSRRAAYNLILGALKGVRERSPASGPAPPPPR